MVTRVFSVFDAKASVFGTPFFMQREAMALRAFGDLANDVKSSICLHPEDYSLWEVGSFDDETGTLVPQKPRNLVTAAALVRPKGISVVNGDASKVEVK